MPWAAVLAQCLHVLEPTTADIARPPKSAPWQVAAADYRKQRSQTSNGWQAEQLRMGDAVAVSHYVASLRRQRGPGQKFLHHLTTKVKT